jgi:hypothetical protein
MCFIRISVAENRNCHGSIAFQLPAGQGQAAYSLIDSGF